MRLTSNTIVLALGILLAGCAVDDSTDSTRLEQEIEGLTATTVRVSESGDFLSEVRDGAGDVVATMEASADFSSASITGPAWGDQSKVMNVGDGDACLDFTSDLECMNNVAVAAYLVQLGEEIGYKAGCGFEEVQQCKNWHYKCVFGYVFCCE